ncbi:MAG: GH25 family lysozyme, partial [Lactobacillus crispatus]
MSSSIVSKKSYGVDVASFQTENVSYTGAKFAIVKLTQGTGYINPKAKAQIKSAKAHGLLTMGYFYANHSGSVTRARAEAKYAVEKAKAYGVPAGSYIADDWEQGSGNDVNGSVGS